MPHWLIKSAIHRVISLLPRPHFWNTIFQKYATNSLGLTPDSLAGHLGQCRRHLAAWFDGQPTTNREFNVLELGTGWHPILPVGMFLCGAGEVWTFDIISLLDRKNLRLMMGCFASLDRDNRLPSLLPWLKTERLATLRTAVHDAERLSPAEVLRKMNIHVRVGDARRTELPADSVDFFFSHSVFQYIPDEIISGLLGEFQRVRRSGAVHSHHIHPGSQFIKFDRRLSPFHFYTYGDRAWSWLDSALNPQTRLIMADYRALFAGAGLRITREENDRRDPAELALLKLAPRFARHSPEELCVVSTWIVAEAD